MSIRLVRFLVVVTIYLQVNCVSIHELNAQSDTIRVGPKSDIALKASEEDLANAREKLSRASSQFEIMKLLVQRGTISKTRLNSARLDKQVAELELASLQTPETSNANQVQIARLGLEFADQRFEASKRLFIRGSESKLRHRRTSYQRKYAQVALMSATGEISGDAANLTIVRLKAKLAKIEFDLADQLYRQRSITKSSLDRVLDRLREAEQAREELESKQDNKQRQVEDRLRT